VHYCVPVYTSLASQPIYHPPRAELHMDGESAIDDESRDAWTACVTVRRQGRRAAVRGARLSVRGACQLQLLRA
jgi:hypothetical protein